MKTTTILSLKGLALLTFLFISWSCKKDVNSSTSGSSYTDPFTQMPATEDVVMYEVNLRAYSENGDLQGVMYRLDELEDMGVNVIWLMPIYPVGQVNSVNSPYCIRNYIQVASEYGNLRKLREFTSMAHDRGMAVMLDWVANHTAWDHPWIEENPGWYTQDGNGNIIHPPGTNWQDVADLNFDNMDMRAAMIESMKYWVEEANVDGFRCDYADGVPYDFWVSAIDSLRNIPGRELLFFAEGNRADHFAAGFDMAFGWNYYGAIKNVWNGQATSLMRNTHIQEYNNAPAGKHWVRFTTNHDESAWDATPMQIFNGKKGALAASVATIFTGGVPLIYGSQEVGVTGTIPFFSNTQIDWSKNGDMLAEYESLLSFYSKNKIARTGVNTDYSDDDVLCYVKSLNGKELLIIVNVRNTTVLYDMPSSVVVGDDWYDERDQVKYDFGLQLILEPYRYYVLSR
ncbi:alpha-amylase family glycosyl hydrolase [Phaeocystidibacter marisrubri]|uniref:Alpha-amylase n=1 Tax=Phaeocystidibacter marisrubri TaxID=1577780 RepID=A0A6L3ZBZ0_9FLAO|nr:alpha-amylase family glycosyl hydrolase [Phaeocystidibacter marisrubri]KAB2815184.1 alpha-amylase [Phaeocystidibacter marisrubri]GGH70761.1 alpha-amylase [Phaeocystidibacter marisrubri]